VLEYTVPYLPQLNGTSEHMNRSIMEKARALIIDSKIDKSMWGEAVLTATYLLNRSPTTATKVTLTEKWYGKRPDLSKLHVFGTKV
jgi:hypothetical protein